MVGASIVLALAAHPPVASERAAAPGRSSTCGQADFCHRGLSGNAASLPDAVVHPPHITALHGGSLNLTLPCSKEPGPAVNWEPPRGWPTTLPQLYQQSSTVVLATLVETHGYWQHDDGHLAMNLTGMDWTTFTVSNFSVQRVYKGSAGPWLQTIDVGANPENVAVCPNRAPVQGNWPLPASTRQQYVLFLQGGHEGLGPPDRWPIINGVVHADADLQPNAWRLGTECYCKNSVPVGAMPLDRFIAAMQGA